MGKFDRALARLIAFIEYNPDYELCVLSSMGQHAVEFIPLETQFYLVDPSSFMKKVRLTEYDWSPRPAMLSRIQLFVREDKGPGVQGSAEENRH